MPSPKARVPWTTSLRFLSLLDPPHTQHTHPNTHTHSIHTQTHTHSIHTQMHTHTHTPHICVHTCVCTLCIVKITNCSPFYLSKAPPCNICSHPSSLACVCVRERERVCVCACVCVRNVLSTNFLTFSLPFFATWIVIFFVIEKIGIASDSIIKMYCLFWRL
jgi:hypothetical protein